MSPLVVIAFPGAPNLPLLAALEHGDFADAGLSVELEVTASSTEQMTRLVRGACQIAATACDNVIAYHAGRGALAEPAPDLVVLAGASRIELSVVARPGVETYADLCGRSVALDAPDTGFAFVLYELLHRAGLGREDYEAAAVGATPARLESVLAGEHAATLTIEPFTSLALARGCSRLGTSRTLGPYLGGVLAARRSWAAADAEAAAGFLRGYLRGLAWTRAAAHRAAAADLLRRRMPAIPPERAGAVLSDLLSPATGLVPDGNVDLEGMRGVLELRRRWGTQGTGLGEPAAYHDPTYLERARRG